MGPFVQLWICTTLFFLERFSGALSLTDAVIETGEKSTTVELGTIISFTLPTVATEEVVVVAVAFKTTLSWSIYRLRISWFFRCSSLIIFGAVFNVPANIECVTAKLPLLFTALWLWWDGDDVKILCKWLFMFRTSKVSLLMHRLNFLWYIWGSKIVGFSSALLSVGRESANDGVVGSSSELRGDEHEEEPEPIFEAPSEPLSIPESVGLSSFRQIVWTVRGIVVTAVIVVPAGMLGCTKVSGWYWWDETSLLLVHGEFVCTSWLDGDLLLWYSSGQPWSLANKIGDCSTLLAFWWWCDCSVLVITVTEESDDATFSMWLLWLNGQDDDEDDDDLSSLW